MKVPMDNLDAFDDWHATQEIRLLVLEQSNFELHVVYILSSYLQLHMTGI